MRGIRFFPSLSDAGGIPPALRSLCSARTLPQPLLAGDILCKIFIHYLTMSQNPIKSPSFEETVADGLRAIYKQIATQNQILERIAIASERTVEALDQMVSSNTDAPSYQRPLETFASFNWESINATVERSDQYGAAIVSWRGLQFVRRSPSNKFGEAIWFSRCTGKSEDGENKYERLITFKAVSRVEVEPVPEKVSRLYGNG